MTRWISVLVLLGGGLARAAAGSGFDGKTVKIDWLVPSFGSVYDSVDVVAGPGIEWSPQVGVITIDISGLFIQFDFDHNTTFAGGSFNGFRFGDTNRALPPFDGYEIDAASFDIEGLQYVVAGYESDAVWANFNGITVPTAGDIGCDSVSSATASSRGIPPGGARRCHEPVW